MKSFFRILAVIFCSYSIAYGESFSLNTQVVSNVGDPIVIVSPDKLSTNYFVKATFDTNLTFKFYDLHGQSISIIPTPVFNKNKIITISVFNKDKKIFSKSIRLKYTKNRGKISKLRLTMIAKEILNDKEAIQKERNYLISLVAKANSIDFRPIDFKTFILPSSNRITSPFGAIRRYPNGRIQYHNGVDFSCSPDDNIYSANDGIVIVSSNFIASGNTVYIYHGLGIVTSYFHIGEVYVKNGDYVSRGQIIGKIGDTGIVTAKHLHFGTYILTGSSYMGVNPITLVSSVNSTIQYGNIVNKNGKSEIIHE